MPPKPQGKNAKSAKPAKPIYSAAKPSVSDSSESQSSSSSRSSESESAELKRPTRKRKISDKAKAPDLGDYNIGTESEGEEELEKEMRTIKKPKEKKAGAKNSKTKDPKKKKLKKKKKKAINPKKKLKTCTQSLLTKWRVEKSDDGESGSDSDVKMKKSKTSRGLKQSKIPGGVQPEPHARERERKVQSYMPVGIGHGKKKLGGKRKTDPKHGRAVDRVTAFPDQSFVAKAGNILFCHACSTEVSLKLSSVTQHIKGSKKRELGTGSRHFVNLESWKRRNGDTINSIHASLTEYDAKFKPVGQTLGASVRAYRVEVLSVFAEAGIAINKLANPALMCLLERDRSSLGGYSKLLDLAPCLEMIEIKKLTEELHEVKEFSLTWDATYRFAEVLGTLVYYFPPGKCRRQKRLICLRLLQRALTEPETCGAVLMSSMCTIVQLENCRIIVQ